MLLEVYPLLLMFLGCIILLVAWLPLVLRKLPLSLPIICVGIGVALQATGLLALDLEYLGNSRIAERLNEAVVLIALMGAGLKLDRPFGWRRWSSTWRLIFVAMPLTILCVTLAGRFGLAFSWAGSLLLGAALSPTDPVLASDVQTGPPGKGEEGEVRFALTSEAGLNDGLAFPFVLLAIELGREGSLSWVKWISLDLIGELALGALIGFAGGKLMGWMMFHLPRMKLSDTGDGLVAVGVTLIAYAAAQGLHGNGFVAVFIAAATIRRTAPDDAFHHAMSDFAEQLERVLVMLVLVLFGWGMAAGVLNALTWEGAIVGLGLIFLVRPLSAWIGFAGSDLEWQPKALMAFFGIRGIGTLYYLLYAFGHGKFVEQAQLWAVAAFTILISILLHGMTSTPLMRIADVILKRKHRDERRTKRHLSL